MKARVFYTGILLVRCGLGHHSYIEIFEMIVDELQESQSLFNKVIIPATRKIYRGDSFFIYFKVRIVFLARSSLSKFLSGNITFLPSSKLSIP
jgi:hypothetical protein